MNDAEPTPRRGLLRIGSIAGTDVFVTSSWFLVAGLIALLMAPRVDEIQPGLGGWKYVVGLAFAIALYLAILLHEASHAFTARRFGFNVLAITLNFLGGETEIEGESERPREEFWIAVVGPITSIAVGGAALGLWFVTPDGLLLLVVEGLAGANLVIGVLNLVPGLPLDGGRVLRAAVWAATGRMSTGTLVAGWAGRAVAAAVAVLAVWQLANGGLPIVALVVAAFLWMGASQALASARVQQRIAAVVVRDLARRTLAVPEDLPLAEAVRRAQDASAGSILTTTSDGRPVGLVDERAVRATPQERQPWIPVSTVARRLDSGLSLPVGISGDQLLRALRTTPAAEYLLIAEDGSVYGVLSTTDLVRAMRAN